MSAKQLPACVQSMGCYCAGHARGNPPGDACDAREAVEMPGGMAREVARQKKVETLVERIRHAALTGTTTIINGDDARVLLRLIQRGE